VKAKAEVHLLESVTLGLPIHRYLEAFARRRGGFVLDGGDVAMLGAEPFLAFRAFRSETRVASGARRARVVIEDHGETRGTEAEVDDPLDVLRSLLREHAVDPAVFVARPFPLLAGAVGYLGYETGQMLERLPSSPRPQLDMPDIAFFFHDWVLGEDRRTKQAFLSVVGRGAAAEQANDAARRTRDRVLATLEAFAKRAPRDPRASASTPSTSATPTLPTSYASHAQLLSAANAAETVPRDAYLAAIATARQHILDGDTFEICLTHQLDAPFAADPFTLWQELRRKSPAPFAAFLDLPEGAIVSSSPERFISFDASPTGTRTVESRPIKGTRPRGATAAEDEALVADLASCPKDRAENAMIVDLVRNDLGRVCRFGTVEVPSLYAVETYATVHQLVSTVRGELDATHDGIDVVRACFPPGSMTGAPKVEAMTILERLEPTERGVYSGALGWMDFTGSLDLSVVIRTVVVKDGRAHLHVGGAIVADSDPPAEHDETMHKARALLEALSATNGAAA
jgi:aminodeoxychorismate synthase component I